jgi:hypothetical protein
MRNTKLTLAAPQATEHQECAAFTQWCQTQQWQGSPLSERLLLIPNHAHLSGSDKERAIQMSRLKAEGLKVGAADYFLAIAAMSCHGMWIEMKRRHDGQVTASQLDFQRIMRREGFQAVLCEGWEHAARCVSAYLGLRPPTQDQQSPKPESQQP